MSNNSRSPEIKPASKQPSPSSSRTMGKTNNSKTVKENITHLKNQVLEMEPSNVKTSTNNSNSHISYTISIPYPFVNNSESVNTNMSKSQKNINIIIKIPHNNSTLEQPIIKISNILPNSILQSITFKPNNITQKIEVIFDGKMPSSLKNTLIKTTRSFMYRGSIEENQENSYYMFLFASITYMIQQITRMYKKKRHFNIPNTYQNAVHNNLAFLLDIYYAKKEVKDYGTIFDFTFNNLNRLDETTLKKLFIRATRDIKNYYTSQKTHTNFPNEATTQNVSKYNGHSRTLQFFENNFSNMRNNLVSIKTEIQENISYYSSQAVDVINKLLEDIQNFINLIYTFMENSNSIGKESFSKNEDNIEIRKIEKEINELSEEIRYKKYEIKEKLKNRNNITRHINNQELTQDLARDFSGIRDKLSEKIKELKRLQNPKRSTKRSTYN